MHIQFPLITIPKGTWQYLVFDLKFLFSIGYPLLQYSKCDGISLIGQFQLKKIFATQFIPYTDSISPLFPNNYINKNVDWFILSSFDKTEETEQIKPTEPQKMRKILKTKKNSMNQELINLNESRHNEIAVDEEENKPDKIEEINISTKNVEDEGNIQGETRI